MNPFKVMRTRRAGGGGIVWKGSTYGENYNNAGTVTLNYAGGFFDAANNPITPVADDLIVCFTGHAGLAGRSIAQLAPVGNVSGGFTAAHAAAFGMADSNYFTGGVHYQFVGTNTSLQIVNCGVSGDAIGVAIHVFSGVNATTVLDVASVVTQGGNTGQVNPPAITPVTAGAKIIVCGGMAGGSSSILQNPGDLSSVNGHFRNWNALSGTRKLQIAAGLKLDWTSGAFDPALWTGGSSNTTDSWGAACIALRPA